MPSGKGLLWAAPLFKASRAGCGRSARQRRGQIHTFPVSRFASVSSSPQNDPVSHARASQFCPFSIHLNSDPISFGYLSSPKPRSGLTGLRWRIAAKKVHWHGHEILRRLRSFRKLRQPRGLKRFERRQFSLGNDWESDLVEVGGCWLNEGKKLCKKCFCYLLTGPVAQLTHSVSASLQITNEAAGKFFGPC